MARYDGSLLKTALQKCIRRNLEADALAIAKALIDTGQAGTLKRRLPVIVAEDCGWQRMWSAPICQAEGEEAGGADLLKLVAVACRGAHDKSCEPLMGRARVANQKQGKPDVSKFGEALRTGDLEFASRVIVDQLDPVEKGTGVLPIWVDLAEVAKSAEAERPGIVEVVAAVKRRLGMGLYQSDRSLLTIAAAQAVVGKTYTQSSKEGWVLRDEWRKIEPEPSQIQSLASIWWAFDLHSFLGKIVGGILNKRCGVDATWLFWAWFCAESGLVDPAQDDEYLKDWSDQIRVKFGETIEEMTKKWKELRPEAEGCMRWLLTQRGLI